MATQTELFPLATSNEPTPAPARRRAARPGPATDAAPSLWVQPREGEVAQAHGLGSVVDVFVPGAPRPMMLSYAVPPGMPVCAGDEVVVPFGATRRWGLAVRQGDATRATREVLAVTGRYAHPEDVALACGLSDFHFNTVTQAVARLGPPFVPALQPEVPVMPTPAVKVVAPAAEVPSAAPGPFRTYARAPLQTLESVGAAEAARLAASGRQVLVVCASGALADAVVAQFTSGAVRLGLSADRTGTAQFLAGRQPIGVGTRTHVLWPAPNLGALVVVGEDSPGLVEVTAPRTCARDLALARARRRSLEVTLIADVPTPQAVAAAPLVALPGASRLWPQVQLVDRSQADPLYAWAPPALRSAITTAVRAGQPVWVVPSSRQAVRRCRNCSGPVPCPQCPQPECAHAWSGACPWCGSTAGVRTLGWDAPRLAALLPDGAVMVTRKDLCSAPPAQPGGRTVVVFDVDPLLAAASLVPQRPAASLLFAAAQAAGPGGRVVVGTWDPSAPLLRDVVAGYGVAGSTVAALPALRRAGLPPFGRMVTVSCERSTPPRLTGWPGQVSAPAQVSPGVWQFTVRLATSALPSVAPVMAKFGRANRKVTVVVA